MVVDLRGNGGGNLWAMLAGVGPIPGRVRRAHPSRRMEIKASATIRTVKQAGVTMQKTRYYASTTGEPVHLAVMPPVAVLIDRETGEFGRGRSHCLPGPARHSIFW